MTSRLTSGRFDSECSAKNSLPADSPKCNNVYPFRPSPQRHRTFLASRNSWRGQPHVLNRRLSNFPFRTDRVGRGFFRGDNWRLSRHLISNGGNPRVRELGDGARFRPRDVPPTPESHVFATTLLRDSFRIDQARLFRGGGRHTVARGREAHALPPTTMAPAISTVAVNVVRHAHPPGSTRRSATLGKVRDERRPREMAMKLPSREPHAIEGFPPRSPRLTLSPPFIRVALVG